MGVFSGGTIPAAVQVNAASDAGELIFHLDDGDRRLGCTELVELAQRAAGWLTARGIGRGGRVGILGPNRVEWVVWAHAAWWVGAAVVPIQVPIRIRDPQEFQDRLVWMMRKASCDIVMCDPQLLSLAPPNLAAEWTVPTDEFRSDSPMALPTDTAVIQFTSGSTAEPKGVVISQAAALAQSPQFFTGRPMLQAGDRQSSWAPFFHDLGLFSFVGSPFVNGACGYVLPTESFARDPSLWLRLIAEHRVNVAFGPQSAWIAAFDAARRRGHPVDLSSLEVAWFAAEGVDAQSVIELWERAPTFGIAPTVFGGSYGLAEATLGVTATRIGVGLTIDQHRDAVGRTHAFVSSGAPLVDMKVRIVSAGAELGDGEIGEIQVAGPSLMNGYVDDDLDDAIVDGWLKTGDLGYLRGGELYVTGRAKDMIIVMGQNYYPEDLEWAANRVPGVRPGRSVAFVHEDRAVLLVELRKEGSAGLDDIRFAVADAVGLSRFDVVVVANGSIEKTTSGKLRRSAMRDAYVRGALQIEGDGAAACL